MPKYIDGYTLVVPKGNDFKPQEANGEKSRNFAEMANASTDENVWFSFVIFDSKQHRDEVNKKVMDEMNELYAGQTDFMAPFDMTRMAYGGFEVAVEG